MRLSGVEQRGLASPHTSDRADFWLTIILGGADALLIPLLQLCQPIQCSEWRLQSSENATTNYPWYSSCRMPWYIVYYTSLSATRHKSQSHLVLSECCETSPACLVSGECPPVNGDTLALLIMGLAAWSILQNSRRTSYKNKCYNDPFWTRTQCPLI